MQYSEFDINMAEGVRLNAGIRLGQKLFAKGHALTAEDIIIFKMYGIRHVYGARMTDNDLEAATATGIITSKLCGENTAFRITKSGNAQIIALSEGILMAEAERVARFNRMSLSMVLNAGEPYSHVDAGQVIAEMELRTPLMSQEEVDDILFKLSGNTSLFSVAQIKPRRASLIYNKITDDTPSSEHFTAAVTKLVKALSGLGIEFTREYTAAYDTESLADEVEKSIHAGHQISFILPALPSSSAHDVIPEAIAKVADDIACTRLPVLGAADFIAADKRGHRIVVLPHNYAQTEASLLDETLKQVLFVEKLQLQDFGRLPPQLANVTILSSDERSSLIMPKNYGSSGKKANIAAIVLAAGVGVRAGRNKLLAEIAEGRPLFMNAVDAVMGSDAGPVFVMTGYRHEEMQEFLADRDINVIYNPAYQAGVRTTIELGLKAVPNFCDGAILIPADMPNLTSAEINKMLAKFKLGQEKQVITLANKGIKYNPVIWSKALYQHADIVPENAQIRPVFMEHADYTTLVEIKDKTKLLDVTYPSDIPVLAK